MEFFLFLYIDLVSIQKEIGETKIRDRGPKTQIFGVITQPLLHNSDAYPDDTLFFTKMKFYQRPGDKKN